MGKRLLKQPFKGVIGLSYLTMFFEGALNVIIVALMLTLEDHFGVSGAEAALLVSLKSLGTILTLYIAGDLSDKFGRKKIMLVGLFFFLLFILGFGFVDDFRFLYVFALLGGMGHGLMDSPGISLLFDAIKGNTGPAMSLVSVFFSAGSVSVTLVSSYFIGNNLPWQYIFRGFLVIALILGILIMTVRYPKLQSKSESDSETTNKRRGPSKIMALLLITVVASASVQAILTTWIPTFGVVEKSLTEATSVSLLSSYQVGSVLGSIALAILLNKIHASVFMVSNPIITLVFLAVYMFTTHPVLAGISLFAMGFFQGVYFALMINMGGELNPGRSGASTGLVGTFNMISVTLMVSISGYLQSIIGVFNVFLIALVLLAVLSSSAGWFRKNYLKMKKEKVYE